MERARERISIMRDTDANKFVVVICGTPLDIPIGFMRVSESEKVRELLAQVAAAFAAEEVRRERERCAKAVCIYCSKGEYKRDGDAHRTPEGMFIDMCKAAVIWELSRDGRE
jgi:hypothetical protein